MSPLLLLCAPALAAGLHHDLSATLLPSAQRIVVVDRLDLGGATVDEAGGYRFLLHAGLAPTVTTRGWKLERVEGEVTGSFFGINATTDTVPENVPLEGWRLVPSRSRKVQKPVELRYGGVIHHEVTQAPEEYQRSFAETPGIIDEQGVFLSGTSFWVPSFGEDLITFDLEVGGLAAPWDAVSQGARIRHDTHEDGSRVTTWKADFDVDEVYLVAGPWHEYADSAPRPDGTAVQTLAFLREDDRGLAGKYLQATRRYLALYESMLPPYPFASFSLVENWWDTGYGMPGFTLLGPQIIRFPFILTSSYPHELLHNWWGNSAYVDATHGNWCEGLTAYMADHLFAEDRGEDAAYRRATLQKYTDFVGGEQDFPLSEFGSRSSAASEAVGYGKALMMYHMVRREVGDEAFRTALSRFYEKKQFQRATFADIADAVSGETGDDWRPFFDAWTSRTGAPVLAASAGGVTKTEDGWTVSVTLRQAQEGVPFPLFVPLLVTHEGGPPVETVVDLSTGEATAEFVVPGRPLRLDIDPAFDTMRRLDPLELPPAISTLMGAGRHTFVLPSKASADEQAAWTALATHWAKPGDPVLLSDDAIDALPAGNVWVLGWGNRFAPAVAGALAGDGVKLTPKLLTVGTQRVPAGDGSAVLVARSADDPAAAVGWVGAATSAAIPGLSRKLPHYTRYSYLAFKGDAPDNTLKGSWEPRTSPLVVNLAGDAPLAALKLPERPPLAELPSLFDGELMGRDARALAGPAFGGRGLGAAGSTEAAGWLAGRLAEVGLEPAGDDGFAQRFVWTAPPGDRAPEGELTLANVVGRIPGTDPSLAPVVVLAHYDHLGTGWPDAREGNAGTVHPGADDNASGVAVALDLARVMVAEGPKPRSVVFAFTTGEEAGLVGARHLLGAMPADGLPFACVNLDTVGRLGDGKLLVIDAGSASEWRYIFMGTSYTTGVQTSIVAEPLDSSDQGACLERGVPAVQLFSGPNEDYHRPSDTADKLDLAGMVDVADVAHEAVGYLAERTDPLTVQLGGPAQAGASKPASERKVSLGTMPDFTFAGPGVRVDKVMPDTPAQAAGIRAGDVVVAIDGRALAGLKDYSEVLKSHEAGDVIEITLARGGEQTKVKATLVAR